MPELFRMTREQLQSCSKKELVALAREQGLAGWHGMTKDELVRALEARARKAKKSGRASPKPTKARNLVHAPVQTAAARNTTGAPTAEEEVESSKYDVGVPTRDLSA